MLARTLEAGRRPARARRSGPLVVLALTALAAITVPACGDKDSAPAAATAPARFFGVVPQAPLAPEELDRMAEGGVGTLRLHFPWGLIDPTPGDDFAFEALDPVVLGAAENGIRVLPFLFGTPNWVATDLDGIQGCVDCATFAPRSEAALDAWDEFVAAVVDRYGPGGALWAENPDVDPLPIHDWQIWNEQNSPTFYQPKPEIEGYATLLARSEAVIRRADPEATIVLGGMFGTPLQGERGGFTAWEFLRGLYASGARNSFEGIGVHPYGAHASKISAQVELLRREAERAGDADASTWITEVGWSSSGPPNPLNKGPEGQADELNAAFELLLEKRLEWNVETVTWYAWRDTPAESSVCEWCGGSGLFEAGSLEPKPSWEAFTAFTGGS